MDNTASLITEIQMIADDYNEKTRIALGTIENLSTMRKYMNAERIARVIQMFIKVYRLVYEQEIFHILNISIKDIFIYLRESSLTFNIMLYNLSHNMKNSQYDSDRNPYINFMERMASTRSIQEAQRFLNHYEMFGN